MSLYSRFAPALALPVLLAMLSACGGGGSAGTGHTPLPAPPETVSVALPGLAVLKVGASADHWVAMAGTPRAIADVTIPERRLRIGAATWQPPAGWSLVDFALHPSGETSAVLSDGATLRLVRLDRRGQVLVQVPFTDPLVANDPTDAAAGEIRERAALAPWKSRDAARVAPVGEEVALALRGGGNAVVAYRLDGAYRPRWRTLVEPGIYLDAQRPTSGSFDPFEGMENHWQVFMDADAQGRVAVGVAISSRAELGPAHARHFGEALPVGMVDGVLVTVLAADGRRSPAIALDNRDKAELHTLRWWDDSLLLAGRVRTGRPADGSGWDGYVARLHAGNRQVLAYRLADVDRGDAILDAVPLADGRVLVAGATGYTQNPGGESVLDASLPLLARVDLATGAVRRIPVAAGPRGNQVRGLAPWHGKWLLAGSDNVPATHTEDADPARVTADGYLREMALPAE